MAIDRLFRTEHAAGLAATLAATALESADASAAGTTGNASLDDDVASGEARFALELDGIENRLADDRRTVFENPGWLSRSLYSTRNKLLTHCACSLDSKTSSIKKREKLPAKMYNFCTNKMRLLMFRIRDTSGQSSLAFVRMKLFQM